MFFLLTNLVDIFKYINYVLLILISLVYLMQNFHLVVSLFTRKRKYKPAKINHKYGFLICARNEANVIGNLIDSIYLQDYPKELIKVFVVADNCTDNTREVAMNHNAIVYQRNDLDNVGKSYALNFLISNVLADLNNSDIEAYFIFDADNLLTENYLKEMNKLYDNGYKVATSFRDSKNFSSSITSACSSIMFYRECLIIHHSRADLRLGTYVSGTGYYISKDILKKLGGWNFYSLTEDIEFSCWCAANKIKIMYDQSAVFYDEQPKTLTECDKQRLRWCKGTHQCAKRYTFKLIKSILSFKSSLSTKITSYEMLVHVFPFPILSSTWAIFFVIINSIFLGLGYENITEYLNGTILIFVLEIASIYFLALIHAIVSTIKYNKEIKGDLLIKIVSCILFPFFAFMYIPLSYKALFSRKILWIPTRHTEEYKIENMLKSKK